MTEIWDAPAGVEDRGGAPHAFLPYQQRLVTAVDQHTVTVIEKSRRTGYSWAAAAVAVLTAGARDGQPVYYMGYNLEMAREFIDTCAAWARHLAKGVGEMQEHVFPDPDNPDKDIKSFRIDFASGFKIVALPSRGRALRGMQGMVIIDEAAFHDDLEEVLKAAFALLIWGGRVLIVSTHNGEDNPFNHQVRAVREGRSPYHLQRCTLDDALADGLYQRICYVKGTPWSPEKEERWRQEIVDSYGDAADEELFCIPARSGGQYLPAPLVEACADRDVPVARWACSDGFAEQAAHLREAAAADWCQQELDPVLGAVHPQRSSYAGLDFGRSGDLTVLWCVQVARDMSRITSLVVELRNVPFEQQRHIVFHVLDRAPRLAGAAFDAGGNGAYLAEVAWQRYGSGIVDQTKFSQEFNREAWPPYKAALEDRAMTLPTDADLLGDHRLVLMEGGVAKVPQNRRAAGADGRSRHGDGAVAAVLAYYASRQSGAPIEWMPVARPAGRRDVADDDDERVGGGGGAW